MKIIKMNNFDDETVDDFLVCDNIKDKELGKIMLEALIAKCTIYSIHFYKLVEDDYKLYEFKL